VPDLNKKLEPLPPPKKEVPWLKLILWTAALAGLVALLFWL
jgi:hypothetical protein